MYISSVRQNATLCGIGLKGYIQGYFQGFSSLDNCRVLQPTSMFLFCNSIHIFYSSVPNYTGVCLQNTSKSHSNHLNLNMVIIMTLWIGNGAVLRSSSQWQ